MNRSLKVQFLSKSQYGLMKNIPTQISNKPIQPEKDGLSFPTDPTPKPFGLNKPMKQRKPAQKAIFNGPPKGPRDIELMGPENDQEQNVQSGFTSDPRRPNPFQDYDDPVRQSFRSKPQPKPGNELRKPMFGDQPIVNRQQQEPSISPEDEPDHRRPPESHIVPRLRDEIAHLNRGNQDLRDRLEKNQISIVMFMIEIERLHTIIAEKMMLIDQLENEVMVSRPSGGDEEKNRLIVDLQKKLEDQKRDHEDELQKYRDLLNQQEQGNNQLFDLQMKIYQLEKDHDDEVQKLKEEIGKKDRIIQLLEEEGGGGVPDEKGADDIKSENYQLKKRIEQSQGNEMRLVLLMAEIDRLHVVVNDLKEDSDRKDLQHRAELEDLRNAFDNFIDYAQKHGDMDEDMVKKMRNKIRADDDKNYENQVEILKLKDELNRRAPVEGGQQEPQPQSPTSNQDLLNLKLENKMLKKQVENLTKDNKDKDETIQTLRDDVTRMTDEIEELKKRLYGEQTNEEKDAIEDLKKNYEKQIEKAKEEGRNQVNEEKLKEIMFIIEIERLHRVSGDLFEQLQKALKQRGSKEQQDEIDKQKKLVEELDGQAKALGTDMEELTKMNKGAVEIEDLMQGNILNLKDLLNGLNDALANVKEESVEEVSMESFEEETEEVNIQERTE